MAIIYLSNSIFRLRVWCPETNILLQYKIIAWVILYIVLALLKYQSTYDKRNKFRVVLNIPHTAMLLSLWLKKQNVWMSKENKLPLYLWILFTLFIAYRRNTNINLSKLIYHIDFKHATLIMHKHYSGCLVKRRWLLCMGYLSSV